MDSIRNDEPSARTDLTGQSVNTPGEDSGSTQQLQDILDSVRADNERLAEMLDSVSAGIAVGFFNGPEGQFTSVNRYFCEMLGLSREEILSRKDSGDLNDGRQTQGLLEAIHPDDLGLVFSYFMGLCVGEGIENEAIFRLKTLKNPAGQYFSCRSRTVLQPDGSYRVYSVYTDASAQMERQAEFDRLLQELLVTNPNSRCAYHLNLTKNLCSDCHGATEYVQSLLDASTADELLSRVGAVVIDEDVRADFEENCTRERLMERFRKGESKFSLTYRRKTTGRNYLWVQTFFHLLRNPSTNDLELIAYTVDVDHQKKEEMILSQITQEEFYAYGVVDIETHEAEHFYLNGGEAHTEKIEDGLLNMTALLDHPEDAEDFTQHVSVEYILERLKESEIYSYGFQMIHRRMQVNYRYLDDRKDYLSFIISDVTEAVAKEEKNAQTLREALTAAEAASSAKSDFLSRMSHDIRTPMNAIIGFSTLLLQNADDPEKVRDQSRKILTSADHLLGLINEVLDMSKIETGQFQIASQEFDLSDALAVVESIMRPQIESRRQTFDIRTDNLRRRRFTGDSQRLQQILLNVLSNATKYTDEGGRITLRAKSLPETSGKYENIIFEVEDNGRGMSQEYQKVLFEPFSREMQDSSSQQGTGLGMAITKNLVNMMGGTIHVESAPGKGSVFSITLPLYLPDEEAGPADGRHTQMDAGSAQTHKADGTAQAPGEDSASPEEEFSLAGLRILAAEDNELNAEILSEILRINGASVTVEPDGGKVFTHFRDTPAGTYDLILMDIQMPVTNGYEATRAIRALAASEDPALSAEKKQEAKKIPIIAMTANAFSDDVQNALTAGMNAHIAKPLDLTVFKTTIRGFV